MKKYLQILRGVSLSAFSHALRKRSFDELEYAAHLTSGAIGKIGSTEIRSIPMVWPDAIMQEPVSVNLRIGKYEDGMLPIEDLLILLYLIVRYQPSVVLEIGTYMGHTTRAIAENCPDAIVHTLDLPPDFRPDQDRAGIPKDDFHLIQKRVVGREFSGHPCASRIRQHFGDSASWDFRHAEGASFFFIDGAHTYEYIKNDTEKCLGLAKGSGTLLWHDVDDRHPGVVKYLSELHGSGKRIVRFAQSQIALMRV